MNFSVHWVESTGSTQDDLMKLLSGRPLEEGYVLATKEQIAGRGQKENKWESEKGANLTFSLLLCPHFLPIERQFELMQSLSLAVADFVSQYVQQDVRVKWSNDIYVEKNKICGFLIQNLVEGSLYSNAVCGIGLNVNQRKFFHAPNPTSLSLQTNEVYDLNVMLTSLLDKINRRYEQLKGGDKKTIQAEYLSRLLYRGTFAEYIYKDVRIVAMIETVNEYGHLVLCTQSGERIEVQLKELVFLHQNG